MAGATAIIDAMPAADAPFPQVGDAIGHYALEQVLAQGTTSTTYRARDGRLGRTVAIKLLHGETFVDDPQARGRAVADAALAARLEHPGIVPVYDSGELGDALWIATGLADGPTLEAAVMRGDVSPRRTVELLEQVAAALDGAHAAGAVHRELRPSAIVFDRWRHPLVADFGVTRTSGRTGLATRMELMDSLRYIAPELVLGRGATTATDVYGLAAVAAWCLTGRHPFPELPPAELLGLRADAPPPQLVAPVGAVAGVNAALAAGMAVEPAQRPASAGALVALLRDAVAALPDEIAAAPAPFLIGGDDAPRLTQQASGSTGATAAGGRRATSDMTRVDRRREPPAPAPDADRRRPWKALAACASIVVAAAAGAFGVGRLTAPQPPDPPRAGPFELVPGSVWTIAPAGRVAPLSLAGATLLQLRGEPEAVAFAGVIRRPGAPGDPLAGDALAAFERPPAARHVRVAERRLLRYRGALRSGGQLTAFALPTSAGALVVACGERRLEARCAALAASARLGDARALAPQPTTRTTDALFEVLRTFSTALSGADAALGARAADEVRKGAGLAAQAYGTLAGDLELDGADRGTAALLGAVATAARRAAGELQALSSALDRERPRAYLAAARSARRAGARVTDAIGALRRAGFRVQER